METSTIPYWHVLYVKHQHEKKVAALLQNKKIEVFLPLIKSIRVWSDRKKKIYSPLFMRYLFVKLISKKDFYNALSTEGVIKYVKFGSDFARVRAKEVLKIKQLLNIQDVSEIQVENNLPQKGEKMNISYGTLHGLDCEVIKVNNKSKIVVRIESFKYNITAIVPSLYLSPRVQIARK